MRSRVHLLSSVATALCLAACSSEPSGSPSTASPNDEATPSAEEETSPSSQAQLADLRLPDTPPRAARAGAPGARRAHEANQRGELRLVPATEKPPVDGTIRIDEETGKRIIVANGVPQHDVGPFPNPGNPHAMTEQRYEVSVPSNPQHAPELTPLGMHDFGLAVNGVAFDPGAAEFYLGDRQSGWQYEALSGAVRLGVDENHAHVQPSGAYHYHGLPTGLLEELGVRASAHSPLLGWAADGFPIYALYGWDDPAAGQGSVRELRSSYQLREGQRPSAEGHPGGTYDGTFVADYVYQPGSGELDACNGRWTKTAEFPEGTYAYFLSRSWPIIPRCYRGTPDLSLTTRAGTQGARSPDGRPGRPRPGRGGGNGHPHGPRGGGR